MVLYGIFTHMETIKNKLKHVGKHAVHPMDSCLSRGLSQAERDRTLHEEGAEQPKHGEDAKKGGEPESSISYPRPKDWVVISNIFLFSPLFGEDSHFA